MLIPLERTSTPPSGYERGGVGRWQAETQLSFTQLTLYAPGWSLHFVGIGGKLAMDRWEGGARVATPLTFKINGFPGERIEIDLSAPPGVEYAPAPYIIVRPAPYKPPTFPFAQPRKRRGVRLVFDE